MFEVLENNKPAVLPKSPHSIWHDNKFSNFSDALCYARKWLGLEFGGSYDGQSGIVLLVNTPYCFYHSDDYEMYIEIREV
jgi:hypothetical protein